MESETTERVGVRCIAWLDVRGECISLAKIDPHTIDLFLLHVDVVSFGNED
jgi:hypothetical protein